MRAVIIYERACSGVMLDPPIVQLLAGAGLSIFVLDLAYVLERKKRNGLLVQDGGSPPGAMKGAPLAKAGVMVVNVLICWCCINVFLFGHVFLPAIPRIPAGVLSPWLQLGGFVLVIAGDVMLFLAYRALGAAWAYPLQDGDGYPRALVISGPYSRVRHPAYLAFMIVSAGFTLLFLDWVVLALAVGGTIGLVLQARHEEKALLLVFGDEYRSYMQATPRFVPRL